MIPLAIAVIWPPFAVLVAAVIVAIVHRMMAQ
jgi:hypothetical protein